MTHHVIPRSEPPPAPVGRLHGLDLWRGVILCTIYVNHIPGTVFERFTFKNFGFSDSSEAFVLIAGLSLALAYGRRVMAGDHAAVFVSLARRSVKLYGAHIGLSLAGLGIFAVGAAMTDNPDLMQSDDRALVGDDPVAALMRLFSLGHQFGYFNILPMYVVLMGLAPAMLIVARKRPMVMLGVSFTVYALSRLTFFNIPTWPMSGTWFFDPFTWQFLMAVGIAVGLQMRGRGGFKLTPALLAVAAVIVAGSAFCATDGLGMWPGLGAVVRSLADLDKHMLGLGRIAHALSLAACLHALGVAKLLQATWTFKPLLLIGQHGLAMFGLGSLLSAAGQVVTETYGHTLFIDSTLIGGGLALMLATARALSRWSVRPSVSLGVVQGAAAR